MSSQRLRVAVRDGVVLLEGSCQQRSQIPMLVRAVAGVEGVVRVQSRVGFEADEVSSPPSRSAIGVRNGRRGMGTSTKEPGDA